MTIAQDLNQARREMNTDIALSEFFQINQNQTEKVKYGIIYFLDQARINNFRVFKTHLFQFFALSEWYYAQAYSNHFFGWQYVTSQQGPIPLPLVELLNLMQDPSFHQGTKEEEMIQLLPFNLKKIVDQTEHLLRTQIFLKEDLIFHDFYFSDFDLMVLKQAANKIFVELKTTEKITHYFHAHSPSWKSTRRQNSVTIKRPKIQNFVFDFPNLQ